MCVLFGAAIDRTKRFEAVAGCCAPLERRANQASIRPPGSPNDGASHRLAPDSHGPVDAKVAVGGRSIAARAQWSGWTGCFCGLTGGVGGDTHTWRQLRMRLGCKGVVVTA